MHQVAQSPSDGPVGADRPPQSLFSRLDGESGHMPPRSSVNVEGNGTFRNGQLGNRFSPSYSGLGRVPGDYVQFDGPLNQRRGYTPEYHRMPTRRGESEGHNPNGRYAREDLSIKVRAYDPKEIDWLTYKSHFEAVATQASWSLRTKCARLMGALQGNLTGVVTGLPTPIRYNDLIARLDAVHGISSSREDAILKLSSCRKEAGESIPLFAERVRQLTQRAYPDFTEAGREEQALRVFLQGIPPRYDMRLLMRMQGFRTLKEATIYGAKLEQVIKDEKYQEGKRPMFSRSVEAESDSGNLSDLSGVLSRLCSQVSEVKSGQGKQLKTLQNFQKSG